MSCTVAGIFGPAPRTISPLPRPTTGVWEGRIATLASVGLLQLAWGASTLLSSTVEDHAAQKACWCLWVTVVTCWGGHGGDADSGDEAKGEQVNELHDEGVCEVW